MQRHSLPLILFIVFTVLSAADIAAEDSEPDIRQLIDRVESDRNPVRAANVFFSQLHSEGFTDSEITLSADVPADSVRQMVYYQAGEWYAAHQQYEAARQYGLKALPLYHGDSEARADCLNLLGVVSVRLGDFASGAAYTRECVELDMRSGDDCRIASSLSTLAGTYIAANDAEAAMNYAMQGLEYAERCPNTLRKTILMGMVSEAAYQTGDFERAATYAREAYIIDSVAGRTGRAAIRLSMEATALVGLKQYDQAEAVFRRAFPMLIEAGNYHSLAIDYNQMGFMLLKQGHEREAAAYFREAAGIFGRMGDLYNETHSRRGLYESYWTLNPDSARIALEAFNQLKDSLYSQASADALARYKAEFETDRLVDEINRHNRIRCWLIGSGLVIILIAIAILVFQHLRTLRLRKTIRQLIAEAEECGDAPAGNEETGNADISAATVNSTDCQFKRALVDAIIGNLPKGDFGVAQIAAKFYMGEQTFRRRCLEATGLLPKAFIVAVQMERAMTLLKEKKEYPVAQVANECGFEELSAFSRTFKRTFGCSPTEYRNRS